MQNTALNQLGKLAGIIAFIGAGFTWLFGGYEVGLQILVTFMVLDYLMGIMCAYKKGEINSSKGFKGLTKKFSILFILILGVALDRLLGTEWTFRTLVIYFYAGMEGISILENAVKLGVPIPDKLKDKLIQLSEEKIEQEGESERDYTFRRSRTWCK